MGIKNNKKKRQWTTVAVFALAALVSVGMIGCNDSDSGAPPVGVTIQMGAYTTADYKLLDLLFPRANAAVSDLKVCFKRLRFKLSDSDTTDPATSEDNVDFNLGEVTLSGAGTVLGEVVIPAGSYQRVEFDLESDCLSGKSIQLTNGNGTYSSADRITIKFSGAFTADVDGVLTLGIQQILNALNSYNGTGTLKDAAEAASGVLAN